MTRKPVEPKSAGLSMALTKRDRVLLEKAAALVGIPLSVWARAVLLKEAPKVLSGEATR